MKMSIRPTESQAILRYKSQGPDERSESENRSSTGSLYKNNRNTI